MGPAHRAATSESGSRSAAPLLSGNLETVFTDVPPRAWGGCRGGCNLQPAQPESTKKNKNKKKQKTKEKNKKRPDTASFLI